MNDWSGWAAAGWEALYGPNGFYRQGAGPAAHFRTSPVASPLFADALFTLLVDLDTEFGHPSTLDVLDVGAGRGEFLRRLADTAARRSPGLAARLRLVGVELADRPADLPRPIDWASSIEAARPGGVRGLLLGNEWLDNVPVDVAERAEDGVRLVRVHRPSGDERLGDPVGGPDREWLARWWPLADAEVGQRAEIGRPRDAAWANAVRQVRQGLAVAIDYGHVLGARPPFGSLRAFRAGRSVPPAPDGGCDITSDVAMDAARAAGIRAAATTADGASDGAANGGGASLLTTQRAALGALGVSGRRPNHELASSDPTGYLRRLAIAGEAAELTDPAGLGGFHWLVHAIGVRMPAELTDL